MTERAESERSEGIDPGKVQALEQAFGVDPVSGLPILSEEWSNAAAVEAFADLAATGAPISFVIGDLDRFATVNVTGGHALGDEVLRVVRETVALNARWQDVVFRGGGDSFKVVLVDATLALAAAWAELARVAISERRFPGLDGVTASFGVRLGGNRVELAPPN